MSMRTLLLLTKHSSLATAIQSILDPSRFHLIIKDAVEDAELLLTRGAIDATILDAQLIDARALRVIDDLKALAPACPILIFSDGKEWEWEEDAYLHGVTQVLSKPVRGKLLNTLLGRIFPEDEARTLPVVAATALAEAASARGYGDQVRSLEALRKFSTLLTHCMDSSALLSELLLLLRQIIGVNRAIIFLRKPNANLGDGAFNSEDRTMHSACAIGVDQSLLQHVSLSLGTGIGAYLHRQGRILRANHVDAQASREISKEFQLVGAHVAIPILDRQSLLGVAVFDERLTGEPYANEELALIFHILEEVGLAIRNAWMHQQLQSHFAMLGDILGHFGSGCIVIDNKMTTLHANAAAIRFFAPGRSKRKTFEFSELPQQIGSLVFSVIKGGNPVPAFKHQFPENPDQIFRISMMPFCTRTNAEPNAALLLIEDITDYERAQALEMEASNLRLIKSMAEHLAHEIGNAVVPLSTHYQLMSESIQDPEFQESLTSALGVGVKRISRLANQMVFLARDWSADFGEAVQLSELIVEAFHEANKFNPGQKLAQLNFNRNVGPWKINGDVKALRHAFSEIILNALQASPDDPNLAVSIVEAGHDKEAVLRVEMRDSGQGFSAEAAMRAQEAFYSTRNIGLGIGLTVSRKIFESHRGSIEILASKRGESGMVRVSLPLSR
ncbi:MAG: Multi-sensor signal transduction histidine kinase [Chthoniobacteraceae bacterium]|nr:Multi-sensor signal transduction histidine kinase [Chthoniobacteraceae bacterium]